MLSLAPAPQGSPIRQRARMPISRGHLLPDTVRGRALARQRGASARTPLDPVATGSAGAVRLSLERAAGLARVDTGIEAAQRIPAVTDQDPTPTAAGRVQLALEWPAPVAHVGVVAQVGSTTPALARHEVAAVEAARPAMVRPRLRVHAHAPAQLEPFGAHAHPDVADLPAPAVLGDLALRSGFARAPRTGWLLAGRRRRFHSGRTGRQHIRRLPCLTRDVPARHVRDRPTAAGFRRE
ncbi:MAG: hypothetical protein EA398_00660 [Deltaproteobacteria bacterium]|nr:MAG: hypothetical protein EA398_00660 [Deltaproteobacteria bacterium]